MVCNNLLKHWCRKVNNKQYSLIFPNTSLTFGQFPDRRLILRHFRFPRQWSPCMTCGMYLYNLCTGWRWVITLKIQIWTNMQLRVGQCYLDYITWCLIPHKLQIILYCCACPTTRVMKTLSEWFIISTDLSDLQYDGCCNACISMIMGILHVFIVCIF